MNTTPLKIVVLLCILFVYPKITTSMSKQKNTPVTSLQVNQLLQDLESENYKKNSYQPSDNIITKYGIQKLDNAYYVGGMMSANEKLKDSELKSLDVIISTSAGGVSTVQVPIQNLDKFLNLKGIESFDLGKKVFTKGKAKQVSNP